MGKYPKAWKRHRVKKWFKKNILDKQTHGMLFFADDWKSATLYAVGYKGVVFECNSDESKEDFENRITAQVETMVTHVLVLTVVDARIPKKEIST